MGEGVVGVVMAGAAIGEGVVGKGSPGGACDGGGSNAREFMYGGYEGQEGEGLAGINPLAMAWWAKVCWARLASRFM